MGNKFIRNYIAKQVAGRSDDGIMIKLSDPKKVDFQVTMMEDLLMRNGIDPKAITSENQFKSILNLLESVEKANLAQNIKSGIRNTKSAKVFDLKGRKIENPDNIMGGEELKFDSDQPPPGSRGGPDDIAAPVQSQEETLRNMTEAEIKANLEAQNKSAVKKILERKNREDVYGLEDYDTTNMSEIKKEIIRTETKLGNLNPNSPDFRERAKPLVDKLEALKNKMRDDKADGGRIGFVKGTGLKFLQKIFGKEKFKEMATRDPEMYVGLLEVVDMYRKRDKEGLKMYLQKFLPHMDDAEIEDFIIGSDGTEGLIGELIRLGSGRDYAGKIEMIKRAENMRKLDDLEVTDKMIRKPNADGGIMRLGLKEGSGMSRRTFLKFLAGAASIPIVGKILKPFKIGKTVTKVPIIKTDNVAGKPEWFDQLVNKVILEGDDVTKRFATKEREIVHAKQIDEDNYVTVTQDLDEGVVRVEYENPSATMFGEKVDLRYKKPPPDEGDPRPVGEFQTEESGIVGRAQGPDDYDLEIEGMSGRAIEDLESDVSVLKQYATGKKPTLKEIVQSKKRKDKVKYYETPEGQSEYVVQRQGEYDYSPDDGMASGGIARMLGE